MKALKSRVTMLAALAFGCTRSQAPSPSVDPSAGATHSPARSKVASSAPRPASAPAPRPASAPAPRATTAATREACTACNGEWGRHGIAETDSCNCRTTDKGKVCRDGRECGGECIVDPALFEVIEPGPPVRGRFRGRCSEFVTVFGCNALLGDGARDAPLVPKDQAPEELCAD
jgi:hypothetical protein